MAQPPSTGIDPAIFEHLQNKIDEDIKIRDVINHLELYDSPWLIDLSFRICVTLSRLLNAKVSGGKLRTRALSLHPTGRVVQAILSKAHSTPSAQRRFKVSSLPESCLITCLVQPVLHEAEQAIEAQKANISRLSEVSSKHPYYKYNGTWTRDFQNLVRHI